MLPLQPHATAPPDPALFKSTDALRQFISPTSVVSNTPQAVPTNNWWGNLLSDNGSQDIDPIYPSPYAVFIRKKAGSIACSYLHQYVHHGPLNENGAIKYYFTPRVENLQFSGLFAAAPRFQVERWDDFGVQIAFAAGDASLRSYQSLGQAFASLSYTNLAFRLGSEHAFVSIDGQPARDRQLVGRADARTNSMVVTLNNDQRWFVAWTSASSTNVVIAFDVATQSFSSTAPFSGVVQAAFVPNDDVLALYEACAGSFVNGVALRVESAHAFAYTFNVAHVGAPARTFLHFALTHHEALLQSVDAVPSLSLFAHSRGPMRAHVVPQSGEWQLAFPEAEDAKLDLFTGLLPPMRPSPADVTAHGLVQILTDEIDGEWPLPPSYYFKGKALQKYGSLCVVAADLAKSRPELGALAAAALTKFKALLSDVGENASTYPLVYDTVYGGIVSSEGFQKHDINVEFGNAVYNDHHYHYGYFVTAVAIAYHLDPSWVDKTSRLHRFVETLLRDTLNPSADDAYFATFRNFDWFLGHSYSHGVTPMVDGKDEESTSEELNFFYGAHLWATATGNAPLGALTRLLLKLVALSHQTYFLIADDNVTHPPAFRKNKVSGILFDNKADYATWFSPNRECIHGIQMLPVTPMLAYVRTPTFVAEEWHQILGKLSLAPANAWASLLAVNQSRLDPAAAVATLKSCAMDDGLSRAFALYMAMAHRCESPLVDGGWVYLRVV
ncbi:hypothetical protein SPRG_19752 [Saprolegnia parasitica CBS 223.65]|uniref:glucan endo-1,3-beta-D-glucosidase n=1 Tax=Saprolegnia parasitica (strain CBS 223.65) TaxID=695850 RepID=A0A067CTV5_SAPPC|nr:hypothetical protein SPRG_19752 [Saprolegnia parasitica CBS 223.65]KDO30187.1 hypothetical protein SPRG_19752 [Saprolegnia parasitica CBS 223.65]|eukprot:XP_012199011.1 hypothetical protein SPRG_19752 [Saprolegnia parasitica CBS 223.65]